MKYHLDTNVISKLVARKPNPRSIAWMIDALEGDRARFSVVTISELRKGIEYKGIILSNNG